MLIATRAPPGHRGSGGWRGRRQKSRSASSGISCMALNLGYGGRSRLSLASRVGMDAATRAEEICSEWRRADPLVPYAPRVRRGPRAPTLPGRDDPPALGRRLRYFRRIKKLTLHDLAKGAASRPACSRASRTIARLPRSRHCTACAGRSISASRHCLRRPRSNPASSTSRTNGPARPGAASSRATAASPRAWCPSPMSDCSRASSSALPPTARCAVRSSTTARRSATFSRASSSWSSAANPT